jgi:hypothetical protein
LRFHAIIAAITPLAITPLPLTLADYLLFAAIDILRH